MLNGCVKANWCSCQNSSSFELTQQPLSNPTRTGLATLQRHAGPPRMARPAVNPCTSGTLLSGKCLTLNVNCITNDIEPKLHVYLGR